MTQAQAKAISAELAAVRCYVLREGESETCVLEKKKMAKKKKKIVEKETAAAADFTWSQGGSAPVTIMYGSDLGIDSNIKYG